MGNISSYQKCTFEDIQTNMTSSSVCMINVLHEDEQNCLIQGTVGALKEVETINSILRQDKTRHIIVYGKNYLDLTVYKKYKQLRNLGFKNVSIYIGACLSGFVCKKYMAIHYFPQQAWKEIFLGSKHNLPILI